jgi:hypothetical protein
VVKTVASASEIFNGQRRIGRLTSKACAPSLDILQCGDMGFHSREFAHHAFELCLQNLTRRDYRDVDFSGGR